MLGMIKMGRRPSAISLAAVILLVACEPPVASTPQSAPSPAEASSRAASALGVASSTDLRGAREALNRQVEGWDRPVSGVQGTRPPKTPQTGGVVGAVTTDSAHRKALSMQIEVLEATLRSRGATPK